MPGDDDELWDTARVAEYLGVTKSTVSAYMSRRQIVEPDYVLSVGPIWWAKTIIEWDRSRPSRRQES